MSALSQTSLLLPFSLYHCFCISMSLQHSNRQLFSFSFAPAVHILSSHPLIASSISCREARYYAKTREYHPAPFSLRSLISFHYKELVKAHECSFANKTLFLPLLFFPRSLLLIFNLSTTRLLFPLSVLTFGPLIIRVILLQRGKKRRENER